jgi:hypothetical protein
MGRAIVGWKKRKTCEMSKDEEPRLQEDALRFGQVKHESSPSPFHLS